MNFIIIIILLVVIYFSVNHLQLAIFVTKLLLAGSSHSLSPIIDERDIKTYSLGFM